MHALVCVGLPNCRLGALTLSQRIRDSAYHSQSIFFHVRKTCRVLQCQVWAYFPKIYEPLQNSRRQKADMNKIASVPPCWWNLLKQINQVFYNTLFIFGATAPNGPFMWFLYHTQRRITVGRTPLDEWSARRRDLYLTTHNTHNRHPCFRWESNPQSQQASGCGPTALDRAATGTGFFNTLLIGNAQSDDVT